MAELVPPHPLYGCPRCNEPDANIGPHSDIFSMDARSIEAEWTCPNCRLVFVESIDNPCPHDQGTHPDHGHPGKPLCNICASSLVTPEVTDG